LEYNDYAINCTYRVAGKNAKGHPSLGYLLQLQHS
jgi:hypothetical protein